MDPEAYRQLSRERWEAASRGWEAHRQALQRATEPVSQWLVDAIAPQPGHTVLDLAAGTGDTGLLAAELVLPGGRLISSDGAEGMVEAARRRAAELGADNVDFRVMEAEWIDLPTASVDGVLCRWGYMLLADPEAALRETRRVLRPGGRVALAAWDAPDRNPWVAETGAELLARGLTEPPAPGDPGMFAFSAPGRIEELLGDAGFGDAIVDAVEFDFTTGSFDEWWEQQFDLSVPFAEAIDAAGPAERDAVHEAVQARFASFASPDGSLRIPARTLVAVASA